MQTIKTTLTFDAMTQTGCLTSVDSRGNEHIELFSVPANAPVFNVSGANCALLLALRYEKAA